MTIPAPRYQWPCMGAFPATPRPNAHGFAVRVSSLPADQPKDPTPMSLLHQAHLLDNFYLGPDTIATSNGVLRHFEVYTLTDYDGRTDYRWASPGDTFTNGGYTSAREAHRAACAALTGQNEPEGEDADA